MIGKTLGRYSIVEKIGRGRMGEVFLAEDTSLRRRVALKFLPPEMQRDAEALKRFIREARSAAALDHPEQAAPAAPVHGADGAGRRGQPVP